MGKSWMDRVSEIAASRSGFEEGWHGGIYTKCAPNGVLVTGWVCPLITRGKNKGKPNYRKKDNATERKVFVSMDEVP